MTARPARWTPAVGVPPVLSLTRPWGALLLAGKTVENRTWNTTYRGPLMIHNAQSFNPAALDFAATLDSAYEQWPRDKTAYPPGVIIGVVRIVAVCTSARRGYPCACGPWAFPEQAHWHRASPVLFPEPVPAVGALNLWVPPPAAVVAAAAAGDGPAAVPVLCPEPPSLWEEPSRE